MNSEIKPGDKVHFNAAPDNRLVTATVEYIGKVDPAKEIEALVMWPGLLVPYREWLPVSRIKKVIGLENSKPLNI